MTSTDSDENLNNTSNKLKDDFDDCTDNKIILLPNKMVENLNNTYSKIEDELDSCTDDKVCVYQTVISGGYIKQDPCDTEDQLGDIHNDVDIKDKNINPPMVESQETKLAADTKGNSVIYSEMQDEFDDCTDDKIYVYETVISGGYIKQEQSYTRDQLGGIHNHIDIKNEVIEDPTVITIDTKENSFTYCEECGEEYDVYCLKCSTLIRILDSHNPTNTNSVQWGLPRIFLDICKTPSGVGIVALRPIPKGVVFGPFDGLNSIKDGTVSRWKLRNKKLVSTRDLKSLNWMQFISAPDQSCNSNLAPFQYEDELYCRSDCHINTGDKLLVRWDSDSEENEVQNTENSYWKPRVCERLDDTYACTFCCVGYESIRHLTAHNSRCPKKRNREDSCNDVVPCAFCKIYLDRKEYSDYHMDRCCDRNTKKNAAASTSDKSEEKNKYQCSMCKYNTSKKDLLKKHQLSHTDIRAYSCPKCPYRARKKYRLQEHVRTHTKCGRSPTYFECGHCDKRFTRNTLFVLHQRNDHYISIFKCDKCDFETRNSQNFMRHLSTHKHDKPYRCKTCGKQFKLVKSMDHHNRVYHSRKKEYKCPKCDFETVYSNSIKRHMSTMHVQRLKCPRCDFRTRDGEIFERHLRYHDDDKPIKCESCDLKFESKQSLRHHRKEVHAARKTMANSQNQEKQTAMDNDDDDDNNKHFACIHCPHKSKTNGALKGHIAAMHNGCKSFECDLCPRMFKSKECLTEHARNVHSETEKEEYKCSQCSFRTHHETNFKNHVSAHN